MARHFAGGTDEAHWVISGLPNDIGCQAFWMKTTQVTANVSVLTYWNSSSRNGFGLLLNISAGKISAAGYEVSANRVSIVSTTSVNDGNWHHIAFNYNRLSGGSNQLYIDGAQEASANSSGAWRVTTGGGGFFNQAGKNLDAFWAAPVADVAEIGHWFGSQLTADEIKALAKGFSPKLIKPANLILYAPLVRDTNEIRSAYAATVTGGSVSNHPRVFAGAT
jgi:hypothetical protein